MLVLSLISLVGGTPGNRKIVPANSTTDLPDKEAIDLIERGFAKPTKADVVDEEELIDAIVDVIDELPPQSFGKDKKPTVKAIEKVLGQNISATLRDKAWDAYNELFKNVSKG